MKKYTLIVLLIFTFSSAYSQEKILYLVCDDESSCIKDTIQTRNQDTITSYSFFKKIPTEKSTYNYRFNETGELIKYISIRAYPISEIKRIQLYSEPRQENILRISIPNNYIKSSDISTIKWSTFKRICKEADKIYILNEIEDDYLYYQRSKLMFTPFN